MWSNCACQPRPRLFVVLQQPDRELLQVGEKSSMPACALALAIQPVEPPQDVQQQLPFRRVIFRDQRVARVLDLVLEPLQQHVGAVAAFALVQVARELLDGPQRLAARSRRRRSAPLLRAPNGAATSAPGSTALPARPRALPASRPGPPGSRRRERRSPPTALPALRRRAWHRRPRARHLRTRTKRARGSARRTAAGCSANSSSMAACDRLF